MRGRGRRPKPVEIKHALGNPGKRPLPPLTTDLRPPAIYAETLRPDVPEFLTEVDERVAFEAAVALLPPGILRKCDTFVLARWAYWLAVWTRSKRLLEGKAHWIESDTTRQGKIMRTHPIARRMQEAEENCTRLEDRCGLSPASRNSIIHRLFALPANPGLPQPMPAPIADGEPQQPQEPAVEDNNPLGFLQRAGRLH